MSYDEFGLEDLADYLHLSVPVVLKLAERGKIPARRVGGDWRFSRAEVHHWLESQIGASDEDELVRLEAALQRSAEQVSEPPFTLADLLLPEGIAIPLDAKTRNAAIRSMVDLATSTGLLWDPEKMEQAVRQREELHPTVVDQGAALMHPRRPMANILAQPFIVFGRSYSGIPFGGDRGGLTDLFFLICSVDDRGHLQTLARIGRLLNTPGFVSELRHRDDATSTRDWFVESELRLQESASS